MTEHAEISREGRTRESLARMSRQIAEFFASDAETAPAQIAEHINLFWPASQRRDLAELFAADRSALHPLVRAAWALIHWPNPAGSGS